MITSVRRRGARWATALALTTALVLAPTAVFAADGDDVAPAAVDPAVDRAVDPAVDPDAAPAEDEPLAGTPAAGTPAAETPSADEPLAETPSADAPAAEVPAAEAAAADPPPVASARVADGVVMNYVLNTTVRSETAVAAVSAAVVAAGGVVLSQYPEIGVVTAQSRDGGFLAVMRKAPGVESAGPTRTAPVAGAEVVPPAGGPVPAAVDQVPAAVDQAPAVVDQATASAAGTGTQGTQAVEQSSDAQGTQAAPIDPLERAQWDMAVIEAPEAREIETGDGVVVGVLDSGIDVAHPDLAGQVDASLSVGCVVNGQPDQAQAAWVPAQSDHGTHVAGTIAAADNGVGIVGVAPGATLASVKVVSDAGSIYPEYALCGFMWAAEHDFDVTNNSYYVDPWEFWCSTEIDQAPALEAVTRAVEFSEQQGVINVAAAGNSNYDLANKTTSSSSPNDSEPVEDRPLNEGCSTIPTEIPGVVAVASVAQQADGSIVKSQTSNYGEGVIDVAAPGTSIVSTVPGGYGLKDGTSMASPHVAGVAALLVATHPGASPAELQALLEQQAAPVAGAGDLTGSRYFGAGLVNAFAAVTEDVVPTVGPVAAVADGTVQAGRPFRVLGANFVQGETVTVVAPDGQRLEGELVADAEGRIDGPAVLSPFLPAGPSTLVLTGDAGSRATLDLMVEEALAGPTLTAPATGATVETGTVTVTGTAEPGALVSVVLATADDIEGVERRGATSPQARAVDVVDVVGESVACDPGLGSSVATIQTGATGAFSVAFTGVPAGAYGATALQVVSDGTRSTFTDPVLFTVAAAAVVPPVAVPPAAVPGLAPGTAPAGTGTVAAASPRGAALAWTGSDPAEPLSAAVLLLVAGVAALVTARLLRRRGDARTDG
ncbi:S8 family serine peptidase [Frigoribacterium sp. ACAM 257]|uniref:S8 family serine peptidase n=1 Tax=Frigoribacterium sp. ACAM 257 TaxID=2508998 RepID=UPI0011B9A49F|nr:S8 family serine peptidase [Frigoribacterium sp. ACAM 257]TWX35644.1 S8 family serine peptidase [Frigoribacterium sp. ACAM 257]